MVSILCQGPQTSIAEAIADSVRARYLMVERPTLFVDANVWDREADWDDLLLVLFGADDFPQGTRDFITSFRQSRVSGAHAGPASPSRSIIPVAIDAAVARPPAPLDAIKSLQFDGSSETGEQLLRVVGVLLGLAVQPGDHRIFVSYRASDGTEIANDLHQRLLHAGFHPWLDEADDGLGPGDDVQAVIRNRIAPASMVVVVDTPDAVSSRWIDEEIDIANELGITAFPVVVGPGDQSRFDALNGLRRRAAVKPGGPDQHGLSDEDWKVVLTHVENLLLLEYQRRLKLQARAEKVFTAHGFGWMPVDAGRAVFRAERRANSGLPITAVLSRCSVQDATYVPSLKSYGHFVSAFPDIAQITYKLLVYDRERVLSAAEIERIDKTLNPLPFILAHHSELGVLLRSNFASLR